MDKYGPLREWLRHQLRQPVEVSFAEIEKLLDAPLPPSSRRYAAHWYGDSGSRPGRAIREAGYQVRSLDLEAGRLRLEPGGPIAPGKLRAVVLPPRSATLPTLMAASRPGQSVPDLLREYAVLMRTLRERGALQTGNNPVSDYAEGLVARAFGLERTTGSAYGYDARDPIGGHQVRLTRAVMAAAGVVDVAPKLRAAAAAWT